MIAPSLRRLALALFVPALALAAAPVLAAPRALNGDEHAALRCAVAFAQVAAGQARGDAAMKRFPPMIPRGREFFVRLAARLMDEAGLDEAGVKAAAEAEAAALRNEGGPARAMPFCQTVLAAQTF